MLVNPQLGQVAVMALITNTQKNQLFELVNRTLNFLVSQKHPEERIRVCLISV